MQNGKSEMDDPLTSAQLVSLIVQTTAENMPMLIPVIAICAGIKIVFDLLFDFTMGITGRRRGS